MENAQGSLTIRTKEKGYELGDLFGIFFEDLNHAADGGLYAELVQNRSFEFESIDNEAYHHLTAWEKVERGGGRAEILVETENPLNTRNQHYLVINILEPGEGAGIMNLGYNTGIPLKPGTYRFTCYARQDDGVERTLQIALESSSGIVYAKEFISVLSGEWTRHEVTLHPKATDFSARLVITSPNSGRIYLDMVSLFPESTFNNRTNGLRKDIAEMLADMKPKFMRFPGGCLVHDGSLDPEARDSMYRWKNTLGDVAQRPPRRSNWKYNQTLGLGFFEFFLFCEDIGAKPIPVLPAGYDPHHRRVTPLDKLQPWIDDALDLIEFANGEIDTVWGGRRMELGHPEPFGLEYIGIGNEEVGEAFFERYACFHRAIKEKYPDIKIINTSGPCAAGSEFERGWRSARENGSDFVDEHYYQSPEWFLANFHRYDHYSAEGPKVFLGEYASWGNTFYNALVEAAYMIGLQKNAHAVGLACYAPMLCNIDYVNWKPDLIWFNNHEVFGTANYYVQKLFMHHQGDYLLNTHAVGLNLINEQDEKPIRGAISVTGDDTEALFYDIIVKNTVTGELISNPQLHTTKGEGLRMLDIKNWENYELTLKAKKISGEKGFIIYFGWEDENNCLFWEIGGWQNQDSMVSSRVNGKNSCLTHSLMTVELYREYKLSLEVSGRHIRTMIDDVIVNETEDKLPVIEPLYYSVSCEASSGDIILKAVNLQEKPIEVQIILDGDNHGNLTGSVYEMSDYGLDAQNSFEAPQAVVPLQRDFHADGNEFCYCFPKHSLTILRLKGEK